MASGEGQQHDEKYGVAGHLQAYLRHPAHEELGARFYSSLSSALVYDFEVGGPEELAGRVAPSLDLMSGGLRPGPRTIYIDR